MVPTPRTPAQQSANSSFSSQASSSEPRHTRSTGGIPSQTSRRPRLTPRQKLDQVLVILDRDFKWTGLDFVKAFIEEEPEGPWGRTPLGRRRKLFTCFYDHLDDLLDHSTEASDASLRQTVKRIRLEFPGLIKDSIYFGSWSPNAPAVLDQQSMLTDLRTLSPSLYALLSGIAESQRGIQPAHPGRDEEGPAMKIFGIATLLTRLYARNTSNWWATVLGLHLRSLGTKDRALDLLSKAGHCIAPTTIREKFEQLTEVSRASYTGLTASTTSADQHHVDQA